MRPKTGFSVRLSVVAVAGSDGQVLTKPSGAIVEPPNDGDDILVVQLWWLRHGHGFIRDGRR